ncbi:MAG: hypothetical protein K0A90_00670 [Methanosarcinaceae archaeon]|nr:hypothetical protein [Methanosarcinaceae archaeon]
MGEKNSNKKPIPYIWLDEDAGQPMLMGEPCLILFSESFAALRDGVQKLVGAGAGAILMEVGKSMGLKYAELTFKRFPELKLLDIETQIHEMCSIILRNSGWGKIDISYSSTDSNMYKVHLCGHPSGLITKESDIPMCHLEAGLISGVLEILTGTRENIVGFSCKKDDSCCLIDIRSP